MASNAYENNDSSSCSNHPSKRVRMNKVSG